MKILPGPLKRIIFFTLLILVSGMVVHLTSCTNPCEGVTCENDGFCVEGNCVCVFPYEGATCKEPVSRRFAGRFSGESNCFPPSMGPLDFLVVTSQLDTTLGPAALRLCTISNDTCLNVIPARLINSLAFAIPRTPIPVGNGEFAHVLGFGYLSQNLDSMYMSFDLIPANGEPTTQCDPVLVRIE